MMRVRWAFAGVLVCLTACGPAGEPQAQAPSGPPPAKVCESARKALDKLSKTGGFEYNDKGEATFSQEDWIQVPRSVRDQLANSLAFHASCAAGQTSREQEIVIKSEFGTVLTRRLIETTVDPMGLLLD
jgi:hypothetical protein